VRALLGARPWRPVTPLAVHERAFVPVEDLAPLLPRVARPAGEPELVPLATALSPEARD
jgi:hypothetical protein